MSDAASITVAAERAAPGARARGEAGARGLLAVYELTKPRITRLVAITSGVGFALGAIGQGWAGADLAVRAVVCLGGTVLAASGANALNQWWERDRDARMARTRTRPLPEGRMGARAALASGAAMSLAGVGLLALLGLAPALVAAATILLYVLVYTPLKPVTTLNTLVGAVPGALPPLIGWTAAVQASGAAGSGAGGWGGLASLAEPGGWVLVILMVVWQIPHFLAIAWMYREEYARGGYRMLPLADPTGRATARTMLTWSVALVPATIAPAVLLDGRVGVVYGAAAAVSGVAFVGLCARFARTLERGDARRVFIGSIIHLPVLLLVMVGDAVVGVWVRG